MNPRPRRLSFSIDHSAQVCRCGWASRGEGEMMNDRRARSNPRKRVAASARMQLCRVHRCVTTGCIIQQTWPGIACSPERSFCWRGGGFPPLEIYSRCHVERRLTPRDPSRVHTLEILSFLGPWIDTIGDTYAKLGIINATCNSSILSFCV